MMSDVYEAVQTSQQEKYCERTTCTTLIDHIICVACYDNVAFLALLVRFSLGLHFNGSFSDREALLGVLFLLMWSECTINMTSWF